jgi:ribosome-associated translation inhibitor RaiA
MQLELRIGDVDWNEILRNYVERRLKFALGRFGGRVGRVVVRAGARAPGENHCRISAEILPFGRVVVQETDHDLFAAIDRATGRIGRKFGRELMRVREANTGRESIRLAA